jgi:DNA-binding transcriptional MocR family regulator
LKPGDRLPTVREAADHWTVNKNTVVAAYRMLQDAGLTFSSGRNGSIVAGPVAASPDAGWAASPSGIVGLDAGNPDKAFLPSSAMMRTHLMQVATDPRLYGEPHEGASLIDWVRASFAGDGIETKQLFIGSGTMDVISWALRTCLTPGDSVALEDPAYATTIGLVKSMGLKPVALVMDAEGITPASLQAALAKGCKAVILSSRAHNPTGACTSRARARQLMKLVATAPDTLFIDDDHSSALELAPYEGFVAGTAARWMVVRSVSKFLGPDLRVAVSAGDDATIGRLSRAQAYSMGWVSSLLQRLAGGLMHDPKVLALVQQAGKTYRARYRYMQDALRKIGIETIGSAGLNIWIPCDEEAPVAQSLMSSGWRIRTGADFTLETPPGFRVTTAAMTEAMTDRFVQDLQQALDRYPARTA